MSRALQFSRNHLAKRYNIQNPTELYRKILNSPQTQNQLSKLSPEDLIHHIIYLGTHHERRNSGIKPKDISLQYLKEYKKKMIQTDFLINSEILLSLSNVLLYDQTVVNEIIAQVGQYKHNLSLGEMIKFQHCLYKLNLHNTPLNQFFLEQLCKNKNKLNHDDYIHYTHIVSVLYRIGLVSLETMLDFVKNIPSRTSTFYISKYCFQYCQMIYNLSPELTKQNNTYIMNDDNPFKPYFEQMKRNFLVSKKMVSLKQLNKSLELWELCYSWIKIKVDSIDRPLTFFEQEVQNILNLLKVPNIRSQRVLLYDIDFLVKEKVIINCNESVHFIEDFDGNVLSINPNHEMQSRHLNYMEQYAVHDINYFEWESLTEQQKQQKVESLID